MRRLPFLLSGEEECHNDELLAYAILLYEKIVTEAEYQVRLDALFLAHPETFGRALTEVLKGYYAKCPDIRSFGSKMYSL